MTTTVDDFLAYFYDYFSAYNVKPYFLWKKMLKMDLSATVLLGTYTCRNYYKEDWMRNKLT